MEPVVSPNDIGITRRLLQGLGASRYLARKLTEGLDPASKHGSSYVYALHDVKLSITNYLKKSRIKPHTRSALESIRNEFLVQTSNVTYLPHNLSDSKDPKMRSWCIDLIKIGSTLDRKISSAKLIAAKLRG